MHSKQCRQLREAYILCVSVSVKRSVENDEELTASGASGARVEALLSNAAAATDDDVDDDELRCSKPKSCNSSLDADAE